MNPLFVRLGLESRQFNAGMLQAMNNLKRMRKNTDRLSASMRGIKRIATTAFAGWGIKRVVGYIVDAGVEMDRFRRSMTAAMGSVNSGKEAMKFLSDESNRLGLVFRTQVKGFQQLAAAAKGTKISQDDVKEAFLAISEASTVFQLSQEQNKFALYALQQMISKGVVTMEELRRQLGDQLPGAFQIAARSLNLTTQELIKMVSTGNLLAEDFIPAFARQLRKEMAGSVEDASKSIYANINRLKNIFYSLSDDIFDTTGVVHTFNDGLKILIDLLSDEAKIGKIKEFVKLWSDLAWVFIKIAELSIDVYTSIDKFLKKINLSVEKVFAPQMKILKDFLKILDEIKKRSEEDQTGKKFKVPPLPTAMSDKDKEGFNARKSLEESFKLQEEKIKQTLELEKKLAKIRKEAFDVSMRYERELAIVRKKSIEESIEDTIKLAGINKQQLIDSQEFKTKISELNILQSNTMGERNREYIGLTKSRIYIERDYTDRLSELKKEQANIESDYNEDVREFNEQRLLALKRYEKEVSELKREEFDVNKQYNKDLYEVNKKAIKNQGEFDNHITDLQRKKLKEELEIQKQSIYLKKKELEEKYNIEKDALNSKREQIKIEKQLNDERLELINEFLTESKQLELKELENKISNFETYADEIRAIHESLYSDIKGLATDTFEDIFSGQFDGWKDLMGNMKKIFTRTFAEMATTALTKELKLKISSSGGGFGNLFGNQKYNNIASALGGAAAGYTNEGSYLQGVGQGAITGYMIGGPWGALGGAIGAGISGLFGGSSGDKENPWTMGVNWASGLSGSNLNQGTYLPQYSLDFPNGDQEGIKLTNVLVEEKNKIILQYKQILEMFPKSIADGIRDEISKVNKQWAGEYPGDWSSQQLGELFIDRYNRTITNFIGDNVIDYLNNNESFKMLDEYTQGSLQKTYLIDKYSSGNNIITFPKVEDILNALNYLKQVETKWNEISISIKKITGEYTQYQSSVDQINKSFDQMVDTLQQLGVATEKINEVESKRIDALNEYARQAQKQKDNILDEWRIISGVLTDQEAQLIDIAKQYESAYEALSNLNASKDELDLLSELYSKSVEKILATALDVSEDIEDIVIDFSKLIDAWNNFYDTMMGDLAPVQSVQFYGNQLSNLFSAATTEEGITKLLDFVQSEYLPYMKSYGNMTDYNTLWQDIMSLIGNVQYGGYALNNIPNESTETIIPIEGDQFGPQLFDDTQREYTVMNSGASGGKIVIQIGNQKITEILLSDLVNNNPDLISEIRRISG